MKRKNLIVDGNNLLYASIASTDKYFSNNSHKDVGDRDVHYTQTFLYYAYNLINGGLPKVDLVENGSHHRDFYDENWKVDNDWKVEVYICWDRKLKVDAKNWRKEIYPPYKENRKNNETVEKMSKTVRKLSKSLKTILDSVGVNSVFPYTSEADDIIYYLAKNLDGDENVVYSADKDLYQCVDHRTSVYNFHPKNRFLLTEQNWDSHVPVSREHYCLYKSIIGDSSDNISGIKRYGPVKSKNLVENWDELSKKLSEEDLEEIEITMQVVDLSSRPLEKFEIACVEKQTQELKRDSDWDITLLFTKYGMEEGLQEKWEPWFRIKSVKEKV